MHFKNAIFVITDEHHCPLYNAKEEIEVMDSALKIPTGKPVCMILVNDIIGLTSDESAGDEQRQLFRERNEFQCGGCGGVIKFEYKKEKNYSTQQMKMLVAAERREKLKEVIKYVEVLRRIDLFSSLSDDDLLDLGTLLEFEQFDWGYFVAHKGEVGSKLYIIVSGKVEMIDDDGVVVDELGVGDVFGELSLLTGETVMSTVQAAEPSVIATLNKKNFRHVVSRYPALQVFLYRLFAERLTKLHEQQAKELSSGMVGKLSDISPVEISQMINSSQKTGSLEIEAEYFKGKILFNLGEVVRVDLGYKKGIEGFYDFLALNDGRFTFTPGLSTPEKKLKEIGSFMGMLMEGMRRIDDRRA